MPKNLKNDQNPGKWVLIWEYSARAFLWIPAWQGLDGFRKTLSPQYTGRVNFYNIRHHAASANYPSLDKQLKHMQPETTTNPKSPPYPCMRLVQICCGPVVCIREIWLLLTAVQETYYREFPDMCLRREWAGASCFVDQVSHRCSSFLNAILLITGSGTVTDTTTTTTCSVGIIGGILLMSDDGSCTA